MLPASRRPRRFPMVMSPIAPTPMTTRPIDAATGTPRRSVRPPTTSRRRPSGRSRSAGPRRRPARPSGRCSFVKRRTSRRRSDRRCRSGGSRWRRRRAGSLMRDADLEAERQGGHTAEDQDAQDLLGRVGGRADGVGAEDRERLLLRTAARRARPRWRAVGRTGRRVGWPSSGRSASSGCWRPPWRSTSPCRCSGSRARADVPRERVGHRACGPGAAVGPRSWLAGHAPIASRSARRRGRPAARIAVCTRPMSYATRCQVTASVSLSRTR